MVPCGSYVFSFPPSIDVFYWHGETFDLPPDAVRVARSECCENQAFQLGHSVIALQFHLETTLYSEREIITHCRDELTPGKYVQSEARILSVGPGNYQAINALMDDVLSFLMEDDN